MSVTLGLLLALGPAEATSSPETAVQTDSAADPAAADASGDKAPDPATPPAADPATDAEDGAPGPASGDEATVSDATAAAPVEAAPVIPEAARAPAEAEPGPTADDPFAGMLRDGGDEPLPRARAPRNGDGPSGQDGVSRDEALRRYYAALYRPPSNPARPYFGVIAGGGLIGGPRTPVNGRFGFLDVEAGASWNFISFALGGGIMGGDTQLRGDGSAVAPFGVSGQANLGLGRLAYFKRGLLDFRVGYRATWMPIRERAGDESSDAEALPAFMLPHGPDIRLDVGFMVSRVREPRFFHRLGLSLGYQIIVGAGPFDTRPASAPRFALAYSFG